MTELVGHFLMFTLVAVGFLIVPLLIGRLLRPKLPSPEKDAIYECGEPTIGTSYIQFDLRFYVVALLFIIFDVEVAFFFPWATVFGGANQLADNRLDPQTRVAISEKLLNRKPGTLPAGQEIPSGVATDAEKKAGKQPAAGALQLAQVALLDILVFFGVLLVGFAYVWKRGDLNWVRAMTAKAKEAAASPRPPPQIEPTGKRELEPV
ncbi:MAG: NADH-quinone oxidoreductase subunit A [Planctomycetaceae bacterium]